ncbi:cytochrome P450 [Camillea tinctor]|nr:cytochrome P450 [Camillea tinctor]
MSFQFSNAIWQWQLPLFGVITLFILCVWVVRSFLSRTRNRIHSGLISSNDGKRIPVIEVDVRSIKLERSHELSQLIRDRAGTLPCLVNSGLSQYLVISQPHHIHDFYAQDYDRPTQPQNAQLGNPFGVLVPDAKGTQISQDWNKIRIYFDPPMSFSAISQRIPRFTREIKTWLRTLDIGLVNARLTFQFVMFRLLTLHLYEDAYDDRMYWRVLELYYLHEKAARASGTTNGIKLLSCLPLAPKPIARQFHNSWRDFNRTVIENARGGKWNCPVEAIYQGVNPQHEMTEDDFLSTLGEILFTNVDICSQVFSTVFTNLASNRAVQNALRLEVQHSQNVADKYIHRTDTLLHRVLQESIRVSPELSFSKPAVLQEAKTIGGYHVPPQTAVVIDARRVNSNTATWGSDCDEWDPDRFLRVNPKDLRSGFMRYDMGAASDVIFKLTIMAILEEISLEPVGYVEKSGNNDLNMVRL